MTTQSDPARADSRCVDCEEFIKTIHELRNVYGFWGPDKAAEQRGLVIRERDELKEQIAALRARAERAEALLAELIDEDDCWFDHHGNCQAHFVFGGNVTCPHKEAKALIAALRESNTP